MRARVIENQLIARAVPRSLWLIKIRKTNKKEPQGNSPQNPFQFSAELLTINYSVLRPYALLHKPRNLLVTCAFLESKYHLSLLTGCTWNTAIIKYKCVLWPYFTQRNHAVFMYEREENAQFSLISCLKERRFRLFQISKKKKEAVTSFNVFFFKLVYYRDYVGKIERNSKIRDSQPIFEIYRHWLV